VPKPKTPSTYMAMEYLRQLGPNSATPDDPIHHFLFNVVPNVWYLVFGALQAEKDVFDDYLVPERVLKVVGKE